MRIVFMGSGELACPSLLRLIDESAHELAAVFTQPDRPKGRRLKMSPCAANLRAQETAVPILTPAGINSRDSVETLRELAPDLIVVVAYGQILKPRVLSIPPRGCVNVHASLLPKYRGAAPVQWSMADGASHTGVTTMFMDQGMDTGDIILQKRVDIQPDDTGGSLESRLAETGAQLLMETLAAIDHGNAVRTPQDHASATYARKLTKADGKIDWQCPAAKIESRVRAFNPWPICFCEVGGKADVTESHPRSRLRVWGARAEPGAGVPGTVIELGIDGPLVAAGEHAVRLLEVQPEGKKPMSGAAYLCGHAVKLGERLG